MGVGACAGLNCRSRGIAWQAVMMAGLHIVATPICARPLVMMKPAGLLRFWAYGSVRCEPGTVVSRERECLSRTSDDAAGRELSRKTHTPSRRTTHGGISPLALWLAGLARES